MNRSGILVLVLCGLIGSNALAADSAKPWIEVRAVYGGFPDQLLAEGSAPADSGVNAFFVGSRSINADVVAKAREHRLRLFAEFNTLHVASYLKDHPDAAPVGPDGNVCPPPHGWQGICPTHPEYRQFRMDEFRTLLTEHAIDGVWLDYHHSHASWERAEPAMPDTCFCDRCVAEFSRATSIELPSAPRADVAKFLLGRYRNQWVQWRCDLLTDWVREFHDIRDRTRPAALLGTFHCPWSESDFQNALREKLAIDLKAQAAYVDIFSPMPYHARFGHADDPEWIHRQVRWLGRYLGISGSDQQRQQIWPIVQLADWGERVPPEQIPAVVDYGSEPPARGIIVFHWRGVSKEDEKVRRLAECFQAMAGDD